MTITDRLKDKDPAVRATAASDLAAAAAAVAGAARACRDRDIRELLRLGYRPADAGRAVAMSSAQMARYNAAPSAPARAAVAKDARKVEDDLAVLLALLEGAVEPAPA